MYDLVIIIHLLEVMGCGSEAQLQVGENVNSMTYGSKG